MTDRGYALFDTAIGCCGVAWTPRGIVAVRLPEGTRPRAGTARAAVPGRRGADAAARDRGA